VAQVLVQHFLGKPVTVVPPDQADIVATGSILQDLPPDYEGAVWGTGLIFERLRANIPDADVRCVRGHLTAARVNGGLVDPVVGDTGLLVDKLPFPRTGEKQYDVGIIPHYVDEDNHGVAEWLGKQLWNATSIDICGRVPDVLRAISECRFVLSSSLHGLIFADSLGVPNAWIVLSNKVGGGSTFKFRDYYSVFGITDPIPFPFHVGVSIAEIVRQPWERPGLEVIKSGVEASLLEDDR